MNDENSIKLPIDLIQPKGKRKGLLYFTFGVISGVFLILVTGWLLMPGMMIVTHQSRFDTVNETCLKLRAAIEAEEWSSPPIRDMNKTMGKHGVAMERQVKVVELCKMAYAKDVLRTNPEVSTLMPCAWGVYEGDDGKIYISGMNMGLMGKMFGGNIAKIMGGLVSKDEARMLGRVIHE